VPRNQLNAHPVAPAQGRDSLGIDFAEVDQLVR